MSNIDQDFVEFVIKSLVSHPEDVKIERTIDEKGVLLELTVNPEDLGRVIGKRGATAQSVRTLLRALGTKNDARYNLKIVDNGEPRPPREERQEQAPAPEQQQDASESAQDEVEEPATQPEEETVAHEAPALAPDVHEAEEEKGEMSYAEKHRAELADLDDLEI